MRQETYDLLCAMIREYPVSGRAEALNRNAARLREYLEKHGVACSVTDIGGLHLLYAESSPGSRPEYLFNAHMDVVPAVSEAQKEPVRQGDELHARGAYDCLGAVACIAELLADSAGKYKASAFFTMDEEQGGSTTKAMIRKGFVPEKAILIIDGSSGSIAYAQKGILSIQLKAHGKGGHASVPWRFVNPIDLLLDGYFRLRSAWRQPDEQDFWKDSMAATVISGGAVTNQIPDEAEMTLNIRYTKRDDQEKILSFIREKTGLEVRLLRQSDPVEMAPDHPELLRLRECLQRILGRDIAVERICGASDARHCAGTGLPVLIIGIDGGGVHAADEFCRLSSIDELRNALLQYMADASPVRTSAGC